MYQNTVQPPMLFCYVCRLYGFTIAELAKLLYAEKSVNLYVYIIISFLFHENI